MPQTSAGLLMVKKTGPSFFLVHPGGPFYAKKDVGVWSIPKGLANPNEDLLHAAQREFLEETGLRPTGPYHSLGTTTLKSGKIVHAWAFEGEWQESQGIVSNTFMLQWPPRSDKMIAVPEADRAAWFLFEDALQKIHPAQAPLIHRAQQIVISLIKEDQ